MEIGTQIAYIPSHALGDAKHPDVQFGFVTGEAVHLRGHYCRYWAKGAVGKQLRTLSCSELTPTHLLVAHDSVPGKLVFELLDRFGYEY